MEREIFKEEIMDSELIERIAIEDLIFEYKKAVNERTVQMNKIKVEQLKKELISNLYLFSVVQEDKTDNDKSYEKAREERNKYLENIKKLELRLKML
ncbi:hypothetical protein ACQPVP_08860 [Clostridium nigeriense]|uniref:hypothetical protein n=1 Tax=Clostridium nigeriense TaxID=1805470 RepID=UPI003D331190